MYKETYKYIHLPESVEGGSKKRCTTMMETKEDII